MVVPPKHPKMIIFSRKTHGCWVPLGNPHIIIRLINKLTIQRALFKNPNVIKYQCSLSFYIVHLLLAGGFSPTHPKNMLVNWFKLKLDHFPRYRGEKKKYLKTTTQSHIEFKLGMEIWVRKTPWRVFQINFLDHGGRRSTSWASPTSFSDLVVNSTPKTCGERLMDGWLDGIVGCPGGGPAE